MKISETLIINTNRHFERPVFKANQPAKQTKHEINDTSENLMSQITVANAAHVALQNKPMNFHPKLLKKLKFFQKGLK